MSAAQPHPVNPREGNDVFLKLSEPCLVHLSTNSGQVIVGYSDGAICLFNVELVDDNYKLQSLVPNSYRLQLCHSSPISFLTTLPIPGSSSVQGSWLFVGDNAGVISVWVIPKNDIPRFDPPYNLFQMSQV
jgi:hypothetical protein